jgi:hypothetical protein
MRQKIQKRRAPLCRCSPFTPSPSASRSERGAQSRRGLNHLIEVGASGTKRELASLARGMRVPVVRVSKRGCDWSAARRRSTCRTRPAQPARHSVVGATAMVQRLRWERREPLVLRGSERLGVRTEKPCESPVARASHSPASRGCANRPVPTSACVNVALQAIVRRSSDDRLLGRSRKPSTERDRCAPASAPSRRVRKQPAASAASSAGGREAES